VADALANLSMVGKLEATEAFSAENFDQLVSLNQKRIYRLLISLLRDPDAADTLTQECFLKAYTSRSSFRGECSVETWLYRIAVNLARDHIRNRRVAFWRRLFASQQSQSQAQSEDLEDVAERVPDKRPSLERNLLAKEEVDLVWKTAKQLSPMQREVFLLRFAQDMSLDEISQTLEVQLGTVKAHLSRALSTVRARVKEHRSGSPLK
jgi:RNA polymerase sigma-70 factor, ECF subfamily